MEEIFEKGSIPSRMIHRKSFKFKVYFLILTLIGEKTYLEYIYSLVINAKKIGIGFSK